MLRARSTRCCRPCTRPAGLPRLCMSFLLVRSDDRVCSRAVSVGSVDESVAALREQLDRFPIA